MNTNSTYKRTRRLTAIGLFLFLFLGFNTTQAFAQQRVDWDATLKLNAMITLSTSLAVTYTSIQPYMSTTTSIGETLFGSLEETKTYMNQNAVAMSQDITVGAGQTVEDLAQMCNLPKTQVRAFGKLLRKERKRLLPMFKDNKLEKDEVLQFSMFVKQAMERDKTLSEHVPKTS